MIFFREIILVDVLPDQEALHLPGQFKHQLPQQDFILRCYRHLRLAGLGRDTYTFQQTQLIGRLVKFLVFFDQPPI